MCRPELADPLKVTDARHLLLHQFGRYIFSVDLDDDKGRQHSSLHRRQMSSDQLDQFPQLHNSRI